MVLFMVLTSSTANIKPLGHRPDIQLGVIDFQPWTAFVQPTGAESGRELLQGPPPRRPVRSRTHFEEIPHPGLHGWFSSGESAAVLRSGVVYAEVVVYTGAAPLP